MENKFSFCEAVTASPFSSWHIRRLTEKGQMFSGGADTPALCGRLIDKGGWDLNVEITEHHLGHACQACVEKYRKERKSK